MSELIRKEGTNKAGEKLVLYIDHENESYSVIWYGLCGYDSVELPVAHEGQAILLFEALLSVEEVEAD